MLLKKGAAKTKVYARICQFEGIGMFLSKTIKLLVLASSATFLVAWQQAEPSTAPSLNTESSVAKKVDKTVIEATELNQSTNAIDSSGIWRNNVSTMNLDELMDAHAKYGPSFVEVCIHRLENILERAKETGLPNAYDGAIEATRFLKFFELLGSDAMPAIDVVERINTEYAGYVWLGIMRTQIDPEDTLDFLLSSLHHSNPNIAKAATLALIDYPEKLSELLSRNDMNLSPERLQVVMETIVELGEIAQNKIEGTLPNESRDSLKLIAREFDKQASNRHYYGKPFLTLLLEYGPWEIYWMKVSYRMDCPEERLIVKHENVSLPWDNGAKYLEVRPAGHHLECGFTSDADKRNFYPVDENTLLFFCYDSLYPRALEQLDFGTSSASNTKLKLILGPTVYSNGKVIHSQQHTSDLFQYDPSTKEDRVFIKGPKATAYDHYDHSGDSDYVMHSEAKLVDGKLYYEFERVLIPTDDLCDLVVADKLNDADRHELIKCTQEEALAFIQKADFYDYDINKHWMRNYEINKQWMRILSDNGTSHDELRRFGSESYQVTFSTQPRANSEAIQVVARAYKSRDGRLPIYRILFDKVELYTVNSIGELKLEYISSEDSPKEIGGYGFKKRIDNVQ